MRWPLDEEEREASRLEADQLRRWEELGKPISFWAAPQEVEVSEEIKRLKKMSRSYQERHGWPEGGLSPRLRDQQHS